MHVPKPKTFIFDFDGTLADTLPLYLDALKWRNNRLSNQQQEGMRRVPLQKVFGYLGASPWAKLRVLVFHLLHMQHRIGRARMWEQVRQAVVTLHDQGHRLFIVSANYERNVQAFLRAKQLTECFEQIRHVRLAKKPGLLRQFIVQKDLDAKSTFYVGNEPADITAAQDAGIQSVGVLWSGQDTNALQAKKTDRNYCPAT